VISGLQFITNEDVKEQVGKCEGPGDLVMVDEGFMITAFNGRAGLVLDALGCSYAPASMYGGSGALPSQPLGSDVFHSG
jgi:hypothetical protein